MKYNIFMILNVQVNIRKMLKLCFILAVCFNERIPIKEVCLWGHMTYIPQTYEILPKAPVLHV